MPELELNAQAGTVEGQPQTPAEQTPTGEQTPAPEPQLPSEQIEQNEQQADFETIAKGLEQYIKDGKIDGKFKSIDDLINSYRELENKYANSRREITEVEKQQQTEMQKQQEQAQVLQKQQETINDLLPQFIENGMQLTDDIITKAKEVGIDEKDLKLGAYELKETLTKAYSTVGGKENYSEMMAWANEQLSDVEKQDFNLALGSNVSKFAIEGLWNKYQAAKNSGYRVEGKPAVQSVKGYTNRKELYRDKDAAETARRRGDNTLWNKYREKLAVTPREVIGI
jgi:hypothetical protein